MKERIHALVEELPESELRAAERFLAFLKSSYEAALPEVLRNAPIDDEPETEEERRLVAEAQEDIRAGRVVSMGEIRREFGV